MPTRDAYSSPDPNPNAATASAGGGSIQYGSPMRILPPGRSAGRSSSIVPVIPPPIHVAPMQAATSKAAGSGS